MIISKQAAEAAALVLGLDLGDHLDETAITVAYRAKARETHPDAGGSAEAFARVDRAKHVMIHWIKRVKEETVQAAIDGLCENCGGSGFIKQHRGFAAPLRRQCPRCRGTGDINYEHDNSVN